jgi:hypothetical protein
MKLADAERHGDLYPDRHLNVFVPFESHDLDYNVTRALISTLRWSRPEVTRGFLSEVVGVSAEDGNYHYDMQGCDYEDFDPGKVAQQVVLGISTTGQLAKLPSLDDVNQDALRSILRMPFPLEVKLEEVRRALGRHEVDLEDLATLAHTLDELEEGSLPDGWIFSDEGGVCVLIEAKLLDRLDLYQLQRYSEVWYGRAMPADEVVLKRWEQVAEFFAGYRDDEDTRTAFLCGQFHDYLDLLGLASFTGFKPYDFDPDTAQEALAKFSRFAQAVHGAAQGRGLPLGNPRLSPTGARLPFSDAALPGELCLDLLEAGVRVELRLGDAPAGRLAGREAVDRLLDSSADGERNPLEGHDSADGLYVRIERLRADALDGAAFVERETLHQDLDAAEFGYVLSELRAQHPPAERSRDMSGHYRRATLSLGCLIDRHDAVGSGDGAPVIEQVVSTLTSLSKIARALLPETEPVAG